MKINNVTIDPKIMNTILEIKNFYFLFVCIFKTQKVIQSLAE